MQYPRDQPPFGESREDFLKKRKLWLNSEGQGKDKERKFMTSHKQAHMKTLQKVITSTI